MSVTYKQRRHTLWSPVPYENSVTSDPITASLRR